VDEEGSTGTLCVERTIKTASRRTTQGTNPHKGKEEAMGPARVNDVNLYYEVTGNAEGWIVLVHGS
jgi:hypothetical protein